VRVEDHAGMATFFGPGAMGLPFAAAERPTKKEQDGKRYPKSDYAYTPDDVPDHWRLRLTSSPGGKPDPRIVGAAVAALGPGGFRGNPVSIPKSALPGVKRKVLRAWREANPGKKPEDVPDVLKGLDAMTDLQGVAPPGWKHSVAKMKKHGDIDNPFAIAWWMQKRGAKPHREDRETDAAFEAAVAVAQREVAAKGLPGVFTAAAAGQGWAQAQLLDASAAPLLVERHR
jgi:hypothetical protein